MDSSECLSASDIERETPSGLSKSFNRMRYKRFTKLQTQTMLKFVKEHSAVIFNKAKSREAMIKKRKVYKKIAAEVTAVEPKNPRTQNQVMRKWTDIKSAAFIYTRNKDKFSKPPHYEQIMRIYHGASAGAELSKLTDNLTETAEENDIDLDYKISENTDLDNEAEAVEENGMETLENTLLVPANLASDPHHVEEIISEKFGLYSPTPTSDGQSKDASTASADPRSRGIDQIPSANSSLWDLYLTEEINKSRLKQKVLNKDLELKELFKQQLELDLSLKRVKAQYYLEKTKSLFKL